MLEVSGLTTGYGAILALRRVVAAGTPEQMSADSQAQAAHLGAAAPRPPAEAASGMLRDARP